MLELEARPLFPFSEPFLTQLGEITVDEAALGLWPLAGEAAGFPTHLRFKGHAPLLTKEVF